MGGQDHSVVVVVREGAVVRGVPVARARHDLELVPQRVRVLHRCVPVPEERDMRERERHSRESHERQGEGARGMIDRERERETR